MKILYTLAYIFAVGSVASSMAQTGGKIDLGFILLCFRTYMKNNAVDPLTFMDESVRQAVRDKCEKNGGPFAFGNASASVRDFQNSVKSMVNETVPDDVLNFFRPLNDQKEFAKVCHVFQTANNFTVATLESCAPFWRDHAADCIANKSESEAIANCTRVTQPVHGSSDNNTAVDRIGLPWSVPPTYTVDLEKCRRMDSIHTCVLQQFQSCEQPKSFNLLSDDRNYYKEITGCKNLLNEHTSATVEANGVGRDGGDNVKSDFNSNQNAI